VSAVPLQLGAGNPKTIARREAGHCCSRSLAVLGDTEPKLQRDCSDALVWGWRGSLVGVELTKAAISIDRQIGSAKAQRREMDTRPLQRID
jgi:hypothetical protein